MAGISGVLPPGTSLVPGQLIISAGLPSTLGASTNEDVALLVERSQVLLLLRGPQVRIREDVGSGTLTVRVQAHRYLSVILKNPTALAKVTGLTAPSGF